MASNFICSSTSNNKRANIRNFLIGFLLIAIGSIACIVGLTVLENNPRMFRGDMADLMEVLPVVVFVIFAGLGVTLIFANLLMKSNIAVYDDHVEGKALVDKKITQFYLQYDKISGITVDKKTEISIHTGSCVYILEVEIEKVQEIIDYIRSKI